MYILTDKLIPDPDYYIVSDIFISKDDSVAVCNDGRSICGKVLTCVALLYLPINSFLILTLSRIFSLAMIIALMSSMMVVLYLVSSDCPSIVILTDKLIPDPDSISDIFISEDDSVNECHDSGSICGEF